MSHLFALLTLYYQCDAAAMQMALNPEDARLCNHAYQSIKAEFANDEADNGFLAFKAWEAANPELVAALRAGEAL